MVLTCVIILSLLSGCAMFQTSRKMDAGPFGENVTVLMGDIASNVSSKQPFYIKPYL